MSATIRLPPRPKLAADVRRSEPQGPQPSAQKAKTGLVGPVQERPLDAVTSQRGAAGGKGRLVWLWPVSVSRTALASPQSSHKARNNGSARATALPHVH